MKEILASDSIQEERLSICKECEHYSKLKTCKLCGCVMPLKVKLAFAECPQQKWKRQSKGNWGMPPNEDCCSNL